MRLYRLGTVSWTDSQLLYHALPRLGREGLILLSPGQPYICLGYFQDAEQEVDVALCQDGDIPIFRREVGGGAVYLDGEQLFYQLVIHKDNPLVPAGWQAFYQTFLQGPIETYRGLGIPAEYRPVNDIVANGRKVSGNGAGEIGDYLVLVGNLIVDFDYEMMARVLRVPDEKFRDKLYQTIHDNLSTIRREIGEVPPREALWDLLAAKFADLLGPMEVQTAVDPAWQVGVDALAKTMLDPAWLQRRPSRRGGRRVTIRSGVEVSHKMHKAPGGLIRGTSAVEDGVLREASLSGDFFFYPAEKLLVLEAALAGVPLSGVEEAISRFYAEHAIESPGVEPAHLARVLG